MLNIEVQKSKWGNALKLLIFQGKLEAVKVLLAKGADTSIGEKDGI